MSVDAIPSIPDDEAAGEIAELYGDIRTTLRVPVTNLVWRHLATIDGALRWAWQCIKPLYIDGELDSDAACLRNIDGLPILPVWSPHRLRASGVDDAGLVVLKSVLDNYDQTNPVNLLALSALQAKLTGETLRERRETTLPSEKPPPISMNDLPRLIPEAEMSGPTRELAHELNGIGLFPPPIKIVAGVPRHLANWPAFLAVSVVALRPFAQEIGVCIKTVQSDAQQKGREIGSFLGDAELPPRRNQLLAALARFTSTDLIANYIPKVRMLRLALAGQPSTEN